MKKLSLFTLLAFIACAPFVAHAADGTISFVGNLTATSCSPAGTNGTKDFIVNLQSEPVSMLAYDGAEARAGDFTINVTGCEFGAARVYFDSESSTIDRATGNLSTNGTANKVQLAIYRGTKKLDLRARGSLQDDSSGDVTLTSNGGTPATYGGALRYWVAYVATGGAATAGTVLSSVMYTIDNH